MELHLSHTGTTAGRIGHERRETAACGCPKRAASDPSLSEDEIREVYRRLELETEEARQRLTRLGETEDDRAEAPEWEVVWDAGSSEA